MTKKEFIERRGIEAYKRKLNATRMYCTKNRKRRSEAHKQWRYENKESYNDSRKNRWSTQRENGKTIFCRENYDLIENYELAKNDNFEPKKWHLHHRLENYWSRATLKRKGLYYNVNPEALIWLSEKEHRSDCSLASTHPEQTKWHQRSLERE